MKITTVDKFLAFLTLFTGLAISAVAIYYSVAGLISIFAAAAIPIMVMGIVLEIGKLVATLWLKQNWNIAPKFIKGYLTSAVVLLMFITSMGTFGYLSKAHLDQAVPTGEVAAKVAIIDEKIKTQRDNIDVARKALAQMDASVDQTISRSTTEQGATRAAQLRKSQSKERASLQAEISKAQLDISKLNDERAPVAQELRKVEAEVGPIKYIAALIYGDNPDQNLLESAVRWVIILIVIIFDPLAVVLLLASQYSFQYFRNEQTNDILTIKNASNNNNLATSNEYQENFDHINLELAEASAREVENKELLWPEIIQDSFDISKHPYLFKKPTHRHPPGVDPVGPVVHRNEPAVTADTTVNVNSDTPINSVTQDAHSDIIESVNTEELHKLGDPIREIEDGYHNLKKKHSYITKENDRQVVKSTS